MAGPHGESRQESDELGRERLAKLLREEIEPVDEAYGIVQEWLTCNPDLTLAQVRQALADQYGLLVTEVGKVLRRFENVFSEAKLEAQEARELKAAWLKEAKG